MTAPPAAPAALPGRRGLRLAASLGCGALAALGQAPFGLWPLALAGFVGIVWLVAAAPGARSGAALAWAGGLGHFGLALSWIVEPFLIDAPRHGWMAPFALLLMAGGLALFWALAGAASALGRPRALAFAVALTAAEALRGVIFTGFPWALPGHVWIGLPPGQVAALAGATGLTMLTLAVAALPVAFRAPGLAAAAALLAAAWGWGAARLAAPLPEDRAAQVRLVQPNAEQGAKWDPDLAVMFFERLIALTAAPPADGAPPPALVIWPETSVPWLLDRAPGVMAEIGAAGRGAPVAVGIQRSDGGLRGWNTLAVITPRGGLGAVYDKHHLVPFGEYMPAGDWLDRTFGIRALAAAEGFGYSAGPGPAVIDLGPPLGRAVPLICYEAVFPGIPRAAQAAAGRADWLLQITNDAWFGTLTGPYQHLALARLRAVEQGLPLLRAANTGVSAVIDARGGLRASLVLGEQGAIDAALPGALPPTPYARWGEGPVLVLLGLCALGLALATRRRRA